MTKEELFENIMNKKYLTSTDIKYNQKYNILFNPYEYSDFLEYKRSMLGKSNSLLIPLKTFDNNELHIFLCNDLINYQNSLLSEIIKDYDENETFMNQRNKNEITISRIYSEIEGTLEIENVPSTRKKIKEIYEGTIDLKEKNDFIISNMIKGIDFVSKKPDFTKENLFELYSLLSNGCLDEEDKLRDGEYYRYDGVEIDNFEGCPFELIDECMDSLFKFVNENLNNRDYKMLLPHIAHYYIALIHPYFDYNGRTARMVSYWISLLINNEYMPLVISDAINQKKNLYYSALRETRTSGNDLTYFLIYIYKISLCYFFTYKNIDNIYDLLSNDGYIMNNTEKNYLKIILVSSSAKFTVYDFIKWTKMDMSKQGGFKILNNFVNHGVLLESEAKSGNKLFEVNDKLIKYNIDKIFE